LLTQDQLLGRVANRVLTKEDLCSKVKQNFDLIPVLLKGIDFSKATVRYGCAKVLMDLSKEYPQELYPYMNSLIELLSSNHRIIVWNALAIIANLCKVDKDQKFDSVFDRYYSFLNDSYMVTVANVVGNSGKIATSKPYLLHKITTELLKVENISVKPHLTEECKKVIIEKAIDSLNLFFDKTEKEDQKNILSFVERQLGSSRKTLRIKATDFIQKWS
jgi:hypothetical protein